jgi:hypothetical protein
MGIELLQRIFDNVDILPCPGGCWLWTAGKSNGYGIIRVGGKAGKTKKVHRIICEGQYGQMPETVLACHTCDTRNCINPAHLFQGTHYDNLLDALSKGRNIPPVKPKLTANIVSTIRSFALNGKSNREIADHFQLTPNYVGSIVRGEKWKHVSVKMNPTRH